MTKTAQTPRRRYSPEVRRSMILDQTADLIEQKGVAAVTIEQVAQSCDVSKSLIYNYFESLTELLKELLDRELKTLRVRQFEAARSAETFEDLVRSVTHEYLSYIDERGLIIERLQSEPSISDTDDPTQFGRAASVEYLAPVVAQNFDLPLDLARAATDISYGIPAAAGQYLLTREMTLQEVEDIAVSMIIGSVVMVKNDYLIKSGSSPESAISMLRMIARVLGVFVALIVLVLCAVSLWSVAPITVHRDQPDAAVTFINDQLTNGEVFAEGYVGLGPNQLHYVEAGQGDTILFLHGFPSFWLSLGHQMRHLQSNYHVIAIDGLGVGKSSAPRSVDAYTLENLSAQIKTLLDEKSVDQVHLVGHDWGAALALGFAQRYPERVRTATAMSAPPQTVILDLISSGPPEADRFAYVEQFKRANPALLAGLGVPRQIHESAYAPLISAGAMSRDEGELFQQALNSPKRLNAHINWYRANIPAPEDIDDSSYWPSRDARIEAPVLFIWGENDPIVSEAATDLIKQLSDDVTLLSFPGTGHWPHFENRDDVNEALADFIDAAEQR